MAGRFTKQAGQRWLNVCHRKLCLSPPPLKFSPLPGFLMVACVFLPAFFNIHILVTAVASSFFHKKRIRSSQHSGPVCTILQCLGKAVL